ncbi:hypothetical protein BXZ70DRAFT_1077900 [Cristinia sonorae]|uniref:Uncharacterized protein n=1 Tax=Cristinia sonorae TaxID=1940300 RepID=A0A8K0XQA6_9AGAR|nr:hypothetical protein BXZ70DRAFT_1077900 [Cristinia sonorae]
MRLHVTHGHLAPFFAEMNILLTFSEAWGEWLNLLGGKANNMGMLSKPSVSLSQSIATATHITDGHFGGSLRRDHNELDFLADMRLRVAYEDFLRDRTGITLERWKSATPARKAGPGYARTILSIEGPAHDVSILNDVIQFFHFDRANYLCGGLNDSQSCANLYWRTIAAPLVLPPSRPYGSHFERHGCSKSLYASTFFTKDRLLPVAQNLTEGSKARLHATRFAHLGSPISLRSRPSCQRHVTSAKNPTNPPLQAPFAQQLGSGLCLTPNHVRDPPCNTSERFLNLVFRSSYLFFIYIYIILGRHSTRDPIAITPHSSKVLMLLATER